MTKKETLKWTLQILASIISAVLTALGGNILYGVLKRRELTAEYVIVRNR